ncbi:corrinoid protein, partial [Aduncisulcus paluster]
MNKLDLFESIKENLVGMEEEAVVELCEKSLELNIPAMETITDGLIKGMDEVSRLYEEEEYFLPEVLMCSDAMNSGLDVVKPHLDQSSMADPIK